MSPGEVKAIAESAAREAVRETLTALGVNVADPIGTQRDFALIREIVPYVLDPEFRKDLEYLRAWRLGMAQFRGQIRTVSIRTLIGLGLTGLAGLLWAGFKAKIGQ